MGTVLSHIVQKRYSQENENIATEALAYTLQSSAAARTGMMRLLRGIVPEMPDLEYRTQLTEGSIRPDMWGLAVNEPRVYIENKFWAGLTENQPCEYLRSLAGCTSPTVLLMVVPKAREQAVWREVLRRLETDRIGATPDPTADGVVHAITTGLGPVLALTSWAHVLSTLELDAAEDAGAKSDLLQLRALCDAADSEAFIPMSPAEVTDQRVPALLLQLGAIVKAAAEAASDEGFLHVGVLRDRATWDRIGRYAQFTGGLAAGIWFGMHLDLWRQYGGTPLWIVFSATKWGKADAVRPLLEPWAAREGVCTARMGAELAVAIDVEVGEERDHVVRGIVDRLRAIASVLTPPLPEELEG
jgi:hypothetical protein